MARVLLDQPQSLTERPENFKPLDFGANGINGSLDWNGRIIALNWYHPQHGYITLTSADPFPEDQRYNPSAVRAYRAGLAKLEGFGFDYEQPIVKRRIEIWAGLFPFASFDFEAKTTCGFITRQGGNRIIQRGQFKGIRPKWRGRLSLQRCAYTQLTEGGPILFPRIVTHARLKNGILTIHNPTLGVEVNVEGFPLGDQWEKEQEGPIDIEIDGEWPTDDAERAFLSLVYSFTPLTHSSDTLDSVESEANSSILQIWEKQCHLLPETLTTRRGITYGWNMAVPVNHGICIITDHMLLPLSWNRDAYYVARALLSWTKEMHDIVQRHLIWMFEIAERPGGVWGRCYLANGRQKDPAFQLDQQLWPLLEFAEYVLETGDHATFERFQSQVSTILDTLLARRKNPDGWLFPTDETPADDPIALPYHLSSHILFWRTLMKLAEVFHNGEQEKYRAWADHIHAAIQQSFVTENPQFGPIYAYATDGEGHFHFYHDANDFPLVLAPIWGFCGADDPVWRATIQFAWSPENEGGYYAGRLGSVHTRAAWPLGDVQELIVAQTLDDADREKKARENLMSAAQWDGALPEAVDPITNAVVSRHWFAWPNAALACVELGTFQLQR